MSMQFNGGIDFSSGISGGENIPAMPPPPMRFRLVTKDGRVLAANVSEIRLKRTAEAAGLDGYRIEAIVASLDGENRYRWNK